MRDFTSKAIIVYYKEKEEINGNPKSPVKLSDESFYFIPKIWELMQDESPVSSDILCLALNSLKVLLTTPPFHSLLIQILYKCIENIKLHKSVVQCYSISFNIMQTLSKNVLTFNKTLTQWIEEISNEQPLIDIILESCAHYMQVVTNSPLYINLKSDIGSTIFDGRYFHGINIANRLRLLEEVVQNGGNNVKIGNERLLKLWKLYVTDCKISYDTKEFLKFIYGETGHPSNPLPENIFQPSENLYLFDLICKSRDQICEKQPIQYYKCFAKQFKLVNLEKGAISLKYGKIRVLNFENIYGMDELWDNAIFSIETIRVNFCYLLIYVIINLYGVSYPKKIEVCQTALNKCITRIINADPEKEQNQITNLVKFLVLFMEVIEGRKFSSYNEHINSHTVTYAITVTLKTSIFISFYFILANLSKKLQVTSDVTLGKIRKFIADTFHLPFLGFQMNSSQKVYDIEEDDIQLNDLSWTQQIIVQPYPGYNNENLHLWIAQKNNFTNRLFLLLSKENTEYVDIVWDLLSSLPANQKILSDIMNLNVIIDSEVRHILDNNDVGSMEYSF